MRVDRLILEELTRKILLMHKIDAAIAAFFELNETGRIKRGTVHEKVAAHLDLTLNNELAIAISIRVLAYGGCRAISRGNLYYRNLKSRENAGCTHHALLRRVR